MLALLAVEICIPPTAVATKVKPCTLESLPAEFQARLRSDYSSWKIQDLSNLNAKARRRWQSETPLECPGVAEGEFRTDQLSFAVLLVPIEKPNAAYRLLIFTFSGVGESGTFETVDQWDKGGAGNCFIRRVRLAKVFGAEWVKKLNIAAKDGVMSVEATEDEYGIEVYFWANGQYRHEPLDR